ncbi:SRPBCC family protein [Pseudarthrobacter sp. J1763]|uniref:SRPBCC family protein n=1 Tax=Pseudarthrobacter sp. J1763 TaxID=3420445 RepID=UPI003D2CC00F
MLYPALHLSISIAAPPSRVSEFAGNPANLPRWAAGLSAGIRYEDSKWVTDSPMGSVEVRFRGPLEYGIVDHDVILPDGTSVHNPLRVLSNGTGSEAVFTLYRMPHVTDEEFDRDAELVRADLARLKDLLER